MGLHHSNVKERAMMNHFTSKSHYIIIPFCHINFSLVHMKRLFTRFLLANNTAWSAPGWQSPIVTCDALKNGGLPTCRHIKLEFWQANKIHTNLKKKNNTHMESATANQSVWCEVTEYHRQNYNINKYVCLKNHMCQYRLLLWNLPVESFAFCSWLPVNFCVFLVTKLCLFGGFFWWRIG